MGEVIPEFVGEGVDLGVESVCGRDGGGADGMQGMEEDVLGRG